MPDQQDSSHRASDEGERLTPPPVRRTDEERWLASWERFEAATAEALPDAPGATGATTTAPAPARAGGSEEQAEAVSTEAPSASPMPTVEAAPPMRDRQRPAGPRHQQGAPPAPEPLVSAADLTSQTLLRPRPEVPQRAWRRLVYTSSRGRVNPGLSAGEREREQLVRRILTPVRGCHRIAVVSLKGGIGKTTTTSGLGLALAHHRGDRVVAVDADPDAGTLAERLTGRVDLTVRDLLNGIDAVQSFTDVSSYTSLADRLQVLASEQDPRMSHALDEEQYRAVVDVLARYFNIILTDSGTGLLHSAMAGTLDMADSLVVVGAPSVDGASRAAKTLDWLIAHGYGELVSRSVAVISSVRPAAGDVDVGRLRDHFQGRCRAVVEIPYDPHLVAGGQIDLTELKRPTAAAFLTLAAVVADGFALSPR
ncbi:MinD/ParA family protein [soil metagenome]